MNAIRAIHPFRHDGLWVFDGGQRSGIRDQGSKVSGQGMRRHLEARRAGERSPGVLPHGWKEASDFDTRTDLSGEGNHSKRAATVFIGRNRRVVVDGKGMNPNRA